MNGLAAIFPWLLLAISLLFVPLVSLLWRNGELIDRILAGVVLAMGLLVAASGISLIWTGGVPL